MDDTVSRVRDYILRHTIFAAGDTVVVAVSGGADSLCLLYVLHDVSPTLGLRLHVAHLDHTLRPGSADDAAYVAAQARVLGLPYTVERVDVAGLARRERLSIETAARAARYGFLRAVAAQTGTRIISTGHTRDDQAETVLMSLARGGGLNGLAGMAPRRTDIARPLLEIGHAEALAYCAARGLTPREDESNRSPLYRRNRMRHEVLPVLDQIYPGAGANIARAARLLAAD
ncbi:MAG: tRNA lysidine(34) synthetase TilS, partial [Chloroflexota bacterium]|nr:tRNA lysidine(34) synthetase TilS [Chloroflexota bacterium]